LKKTISGKKVGKSSQHEPEDLKKKSQPGGEKITSWQGGSLTAREEISSVAARSGKTRRGNGGPKIKMPQRVSDTALKRGNKMNTNGGRM